jgi:hypothetical protein
MRRAAKIDASQTEIVEGLKDAGLTILSTASLGRGAPDVVAGGSLPCPHCGARFKQNVMLEIKDGAKFPSQRKLTEAEETFHETWKGQVAIVNDLDEALHAIGASK